MDNTRKVKFIYPQSQVRNYNTDTVQGLATTSRLSYHSTYSQSDSHSSKTSKRVNQLPPKPKINIKQKKQQLTKEQPNFQDKFQLKSLLPRYGGGDVQAKNGTMSYNSIKPALGLQKYMNLCGIQRGNSLNGCSCFPCKWKKLWTKNYTQKNDKLYSNLKKEKADDKNSEQIRKDIHRTYPQCPTFNRNNEFVNRLSQILLMYSIYDPQVGYAQGMNMVAAVLLYHIKDTQKTFWAFVDLMDDQQLRMIYFGEFQHLKKHCQILRQIICKKTKDLHKHMEDLGIIPDVFFYGWLLSLMSNCVPLQYMHLVVQKFRENGWNFMYKLILTYLVFIKQKLLFCEDSSQFLMNITNDTSKQIGMHWQQMIQNCHKVQF